MSDISRRPFTEEVKDFTGLKLKRMENERGMPTGYERAGRYIRYVYSESGVYLGAFRKSWSGNEQWLDATEFGSSPYADNLGWFARAGATLKWMFSSHPSDNDINLPLGMM